MMKLGCAITVIDTDGKTSRVPEVGYTLSQPEAYEQFLYIQGLDFITLVFMDCVQIFF